MLCRPARSSDWLVSVITNSEFDFSAFIQNGVRNRGVIEQRFALGVAPRSQAQVALFVAHEDVAALGARQLQSRVQQRDQNFVEHAGRVQLARGFEKKGQLFQIGGVGRDLNPGNLAQELARRIRAGVMGMEDDVGNIADTELDAIVPLQSLALYPFAVDESSMLAALVDDAKLPVFGGDQSMVAGDARIGDHQVLINLASDGERSVVEIDGALVVPLHEHQGGKNPRPGGRNRTRDGLKSHVALPCFSYRLRRVKSIWPKQASWKSSSPATQGGQRFLLSVKHLENRCQLGNLQHIAQTLAQTGQLDVGAGRARGRIDAHQRSQAATIDIGHIGKIQDQSRRSSSKLLSDYRAKPWLLLRT